MLICGECKLCRIERVGLRRRKVRRCGIHERIVGERDRCTATERELLDVMAALRRVRYELNGR